MSKRNAIRVVGLRAAFSGSGMQAAEIVTDGAALTEAGPVAYKRFPGKARRRIAAGGAKAAETAENTAAGLLDGFARPDLVGFQGPITHFDADRAAIAEAGDGALLARAAGLPVAWDFLSADLRLGGLGLTVPACFSHALARWAGLDGPFLHLDLGTRATLVLADPAIADPMAAGAVRATEPGPGMGLLAAVKATSRRGKVAAGIPEALLEKPFFARMPPKLADAGLTEAALLAVADLKPAVRVATLAAFVAAGIAEAVSAWHSDAACIWISGRGAEVPLLVQMIAAATGVPVTSVAALGVDPAATKAMAVAYLAARALRGLPTSGPSTTGVAAAICGATISRPAGA